MNNRDCPHGHKLGKCDTCELIEAEKRIALLEAVAEAAVHYIDPDSPVRLSEFEADLARLQSTLRAAGYLKEQKK